MRPVASGIASLILRNVSRHEPSRTVPESVPSEGGRARFGLFDPGIEDHRATPSSNLGDLIIQEAVDRELRALFGRPPEVRVTTQARLGPEHHRALRRCDWLFVGGTNLLSSQVGQYRQWQIGLPDALRIRRAILLGVGWWQYQDDADFASRCLWKSALSFRHLHSVRDAYTEHKLKAMGLRNVINTGCPTMWPLAAFDFGHHPHAKADTVLLMLTDYLPAPEHDRALALLLARHYREVVFWPQGRRDLEYMRELQIPVTPLEHSFAALNEFLQSPRVFDYVGTRLHGGVRCLLANRRSLIVGIDNRAAEIARDTGLAVVPRGDLAAIERWIPGSPPPAIRLNVRAIEQWRAQFRSDSGAPA